MNADRRLTAQKVVRTFGSALAAFAVSAAIVSAQAPDRAKPPAAGPPPAVKLPTIVKRQLANKLPVWVVELHEVPVVQVNLLVRAPGTPMEDAPAVDPLDLVRTIAVARLLMPGSRVRLSAGRTALSPEAQALCFLAGANSIFLGERLLTTPNPAPDEDALLLERLGMRVG